MVYLDYNASTPVDQRVSSVFHAAAQEFANPSSIQHRAGQAAAEVVQEARTRVAAFVGRPGQDVVFTSGASEAAVIGLVGCMLGALARPNIVVGATEHEAVLAAAALGARLTGGEVRTVRVDRHGVIDLDCLADLVDDSVSVVAVMAANNETGVIAPTDTAAAIARDAGALHFVDVTQAAGKAPWDSLSEDADLMVCSSHKIYGPKGAGALIASRHVQKNIVSLLGSGGQERGLRGGTHNTAAIAGFGAAAELAAKEQPSDTAHCAQLRAQLHSDLTAELDGVSVNGHGAQRLSNTLNVRFAGAEAEAVMASMPEICVSTGSACQSANPTYSHVLLAMGMGQQHAAESVRISLGRPTTHEHIAKAAAAIIAAVKRVRALTRDHQRGNS